MSYAGINAISEKSYRGLDATDSMSPELRQCVHEFGYSIVASFIQAGITKVPQIRNLVHTCWMGARQPGQRHSSKGKSPVSEHLDWVMMQAGAGITAAALLRILDLHNMAIVPKEPSTVMVTASMDAVKFMGTVDKPTKHRNRLRAAIEASSRRLWPQIAG